MCGSYNWSLIPHSLHPRCESRKAEIVYIICIILIDNGIALKEVPLTPGPEAVSIVAHQSE